ncbi:MAG: L,D-transpeptidase [Candidatus Cloacimonetes bacterium]|nr:L,D-transpeptidase [Candidatus Cloacimonadota bacterium]
MRIALIIGLMITMLLLTAEKPDTTDVSVVPDTLRQAEEETDSVDVSVQSDTLQRATMEDSIMNQYLVIDIKNFRLYLYEDDKLLKKYKIATGKNTGDKRMVGDCRTPLGDFRIEGIEPSAHWVYDYGDGKGNVNAYGPWFIRLETHVDQTFSGKEWTGIGIHGTHEEDSIGTRISRGCLRMHNKDLLELVNYLKSLPDLHIKVYIREQIKDAENFNL